MKVSKMFKVMPLVLLVFSIFILSPGLSWGEHPWDENGFEGGPPVIPEPIDNPDGEDGDLDEPQGSVGSATFGTGLFWWELIIDSVSKDSKTAPANDYNSSLDSDTRSGNYN